MKSERIILLDSAALLNACTQGIGADADWRVQVEGLQSAYRATVTLAVPIGGVADGLGVAYPLKENTHTHDWVRATADQMTRETVDQKIPALAEAVIRAEAEAVYSLWQVGETVKFADRRGRQFAGKLTALSLEQIRVSGNRISAADFSEEMVVHLDPEESRRAVDKYVRRALEENKRAREKLTSDTLPEMVAAVYEQERFVWFREKWYSKEEMMSLLERLQQEEVDRKYQEGVDTHMRTSGFERVDGLWLPREEIARRDRERKELAKQRQREEALRKQEEAQRQQEEARRQQEEEQRQAEMQSIVDTVKGFLQAQPDYTEIARFWDTQTAGDPMTILDARGTVGRVALTSESQASVPARLSFRNDADVSFRNREVLFRLAKRDGVWLITEMSLVTGR